MDIKNNSDLLSWDDGAENYLASASEGQDKFKTLIDTPAFISLLGNIEGKKVLDIGCGNGDLLKVVITGKAEAYGIDGSPSMIAAAKTNCPSGNFLVCDLMNDDIPFSEGFFDVVTSKMMLMNVASISLVAKKVYRVLKAGGIFAVDILHPFRPILKPLLQQTISYDTGLNYFAETKGAIRFGKQDYAYYYRPISLYLNSFLEGGFQLIRIQEPHVTKELADEYPEELPRVNQPLSMHFLFKKA